MPTMTLRDLPDDLHAGLCCGRGRHPAGQNLGECFGYALARRCGEPLLFTGEDFARTDIAAA